MRRVAGLVLLVFCSGAAARAQRLNVDPAHPYSASEQKQSQKLYNKSLKEQQKAAKKNEKAQRKAWKKQQKEMNQASNERQKQIEQSQHGQHH